MRMRIGLWLFSLLCTTAGLCVNINPDQLFHDVPPHEPVVAVSPSLCCLVADHRLAYACDRVFRPRSQRSPSAVTVALLLLLGGVETNPGPPTAASSIQCDGMSSSHIHCGLVNARSADRKPPLVHDVIHDERLDLLAVTETRSTGTPAYLASLLESYIQLYFTIMTW